MLNNLSFQIFVSIQQHNNFLILGTRVLFLIFFYGLTFKSFDKNLFIIFICFSFAAITIFTSPSQGWYFWFIPLHVYFVSKQKNFNKIFFWLFIFSYFIYFLVIPESDFLSLNFFSNYENSLYNLVPFNDEIKSIIKVYVLYLQIVLIVNIIFILNNGIEEKNKLLDQLY